jgi:hypothetical protein
MQDKMTSCVGCGYCCIKAMCAEGIRYYGRHYSRCPSLVWDEKANRYWCQLARDGKINVLTGYGCTSNLNTWRRDVKKR